MTNDFTNGEANAANPAARISLPPELLRQRSAQLAQVAAELKTELFGIDAIIDRVIESVRAWYVLPHIINRPVIVCLWGQGLLTLFSGDALRVKKAVSKAQNAAGVDPGKALQRRAQPF